jgi:cysteinyl-tRNA synthetase
MSDYGRLSNRALDEMEAGARVEVAPYKKDAMDFVLWKPSKKGEPSWLSPSGIAVRGRPGWHIECSAMAGAHLGDIFDIHGGGIDLIFPHHENEIAQSRCAHGTEVMARYWMHNGFLQVEGEKMSKSLGNFITIHELLETDKFGGRRWSGEVLRLAILMTHYRQPLDFTVRSLEVADKVLSQWYRKIGDVAAASKSDWLDEVNNALADDLNTPGAITKLHAAADGISKDDKSDAPARFKAAANSLGLLTCTEEEWRVEAEERVGVDKCRVQQLIASRLSARQAKNFEEADRIRDELAAMGIALEDSKDPKTGEIVTKWEVAR